jgi:hypothetical protein
MPAPEGHGFGGEAANTGSISMPAETKDVAPGEMKDVLERHNELRKKHCAEPLVWSKDLAKVAQSWADKLGARCALQHSSGDYGENLAAGSVELMGPGQVAEMWYSEIDKFDFAKGGFSGETGHFTQLVWRGTQRLGCGVSSCKSLRIWVCNYDPPGNVMGEYRENVKATTCR